MASGSATIVCGASATASVCLARQSSRRRRARHRQEPGSRRRAGRRSPRRLADGDGRHRHAARHLHDREKGSRPSSASICTGTPMTGSGVIAAVMPGRCAAPPAPAMITLRPRALAPRGIVVTGGRACGGPKRPSFQRKRRDVPAPRRRGCMVGQSDCEPMMTPTSAASGTAFDGGLLVMGASPSGPLGKAALIAGRGGAASPATSGRGDAGRLDGGA